MSSRRLVNRGRANQDSTPVQRSRHCDAEAVQQPTPLPPYEPPTCALRPSAKRALENLCVNHDYTKYKKHLTACITTITNSIHDSNDRVRNRKEALAKASSKRREGEDGEDEPNPQEHVVRGMENKVASLTAKADKAIRDLIDYGDELSMRDTIMKEVSANITAAPAPGPSAFRRRRLGSNDEEDAENENGDVKDDEDPEAEQSIDSAVELMKKAQDKYAMEYAARSMRLRYDTNDYRSFKRLVIMGLKGPNTHVPAPRTWFAEDHQDDASLDGPRDESEDDVIIESATMSFKCPLTLQTFQEPYSNDKCKHVYEKSAILGYINEHGIAHASQGQPRRGPKQVKCVEVGCDAMLEVDDFHIDNVILRQIKQAARQAARDLEDDDDDEPVPPSTQNDHSAEADKEDDAIDVDEEHSKTLAKGKKDRQQSRGLRQPKSLSPGSDGMEAMDTE